MTCSRLYLYLLSMLTFLINMFIISFYLNPVWEVNSGFLGGVVFVLFVFLRCDMYNALVSISVSSCKYANAISLLTTIQ